MSDETNRYRTSLIKSSVAGFVFMNSCRSCQLNNKHQPSDLLYLNVCARLSSALSVGDTPPTPTPNDANFKRKCSRYKVTYTLIVGSLHYFVFIEEGFAFLQKDYKSTVIFVT